MLITEDDVAQTTPQTPFMKHGEGRDCVCACAPLVGAPEAKKLP